jgi:hypothetical protein
MPIAKRPKLIAPNLLVNGKPVCCASLDNAHKRKSLSRRNANPTHKKDNSKFLTKRKGPTVGVTGKGGMWQKKPPDAESASWGRFPESAGKAPHLSGARGVGQFLTYG